MGDLITYTGKVWKQMNNMGRTWERQDIAQDTRALYLLIGYYCFIGRCKVAGEEDYVYIYKKYVDSR